MMLGQEVLTVRNFSSEEKFRFEKQILLSSLNNLFQLNYWSLATRAQVILGVI